MPAQIPIAVPRWRGGNVTAMIESVAGFISAAPTPWATRAAISVVAARREPAGQRGEREDRDAHDEDEPASVRVGELAADEHEGGEGERVAGDDPLELGQLHAEVALDRRQRDVHDGVVEHDHEQPERDGARASTTSCSPPSRVLRTRDLTTLEVSAHYASNGRWRRRG